MNHSQDEQFKDGVGVQSAEQHLQRYCDEFAIRWNNRSALGIEDFDRAAELLRGAKGKRLTYRRPDEAQNA